jgi:hypothetical protein
MLRIHLLGSRRISVKIRPEAASNRWAKGCPLATMLPSEDNDDEH